MIIFLKFRNKKIKVNAREVSFFGKIIGLMFSRREKAKNLLFKFSKSVNTPIHSWFVFYPFLAIWLDKKNKIIEYKKVKPFSFSIKPRREFKKLIEIPINKRNAKVVKTLDGKTD
ncbi:DUF192 domain-containing protein [Candidatus Pacearchaeota archaeon]|nr:DUF192 domain-containing protein [Candidatus Pacearchaeota archaeon]